RGLWLVGGLPEPIALRPEHVGERDGLAEAHVGRSVAVLEDAACAEQRAEGFPLLLLAPDLPRVRLLFRNAPVVQRDRHEVEIAPEAADEARDQGREHAEPRGEDLPRACAAPLDEELLRVALADQEREVLAEDHLVELVVVERAADEEG